ncbi:hypothetical protein [Paenibacillus sp. YN15]|uniref:hypothetical protein n=1 Tax=Paenibacillus sp. YN15 TaxID=1742774 RepID=UPI000DCCA3FD|nr:hypothetical protein [Paenibacillus sp. YN15]RAV06495.1 hypothetical protein DQG13_01280 [Paenibacillus sp. YN15]
MNRTLSVMRMQAKDLFSWLYLPWIIVGGNFLINLVTTSAIHDEDTTVSTGGMASIFIYFMIIGLIILHQTFPFALGLSVRRTDYFRGTIAIAGIAAAISALIIVIMSAIEGQLGGWLGSFYFFRLYFISDHGFLSELWFYFSLILHLFFSGFLVSCLFRRLGGIKLTVILGALFILFTVFSLMASYYGWWLEIGKALASLGAIKIISLAFLVTLAYAGFSYALLRKTTV